MTAPIEDLVRQALAETPTPSASTDPLAALDRRVRRARRRLAAGAGVVAAVVAAAIVVPLAVVGGNGSPKSVGIVNPPKSLPAGTTELWPSGAIWVSAQPDGRRWLLADGGEQNYGYLVPPGNKTGSMIPVEDPADYIVAGDNVIWVVGGGDGGENLSRLTALDIRTGNVATLPFRTALLSYAVAIDNSLYVAADSDSPNATVDRVDLVNGVVTVTDSKPVPMAEEMVASGDKHIWVHAGRHLVDIVPSATGVDIAETVEWGTGQIFADTLPRSGPAGVWAYDGRLIALDPSALAGCVSCAEGYRVVVPGRPNAAVETHDGLFVAVPGAGLSFYAPDSLRSGSTPVTASLPDAQVITMTADPSGGVDYVGDQGRLIHWQPEAR